MNIARTYHAIDTDGSNLYLEDIIDHIEKLGAKKIEAACMAADELCRVMVESVSYHVVEEGDMSSRHRYTTTDYIGDDYGTPSEGSLFTMDNEIVLICPEGEHEDIATVHGVEWNHEGEVYAAAINADSAGLQVLLRTSEGWKLLM